EHILADVAESEVTRSASGQGEFGLTLAEIQHIASEAGLNPAAVATAAAALNRTPSRIADPRRLALQAKVAESVSLARPLNDAEWRQLVVLLRDTFEASGREQQVEGRWEWRNGNLRVAVESMGTGALLDMRTTKSSARALAGGGL